MSKVKIKKTGEVVDVICFSCNTRRCKYDSVSYIDSKGIEHVEEPLNYYWDFEEITNIDNTIDWEQRRYEIAKDVTAILAQRPGSVYDCVVYSAIKITDKLIERLKEK